MNRQSTGIEKLPKKILAFFRKFGTCFTAPLETGCGPDNPSSLNDGAFSSRFSSWRSEFPDNYWVQMVLRRFIHTAYEEKKLTLSSNR